MTDYDVIITPDAENDLNDLDEHISVTLQSPDIAIAYIRTIREKILSLQNNPGRYRCLDEEPWHTMGIRRLNVKNFAVFYTIIDEYNEVYIQNIIYQRRDIQRFLLNLLNDSEDDQTLCSG